MNARRARLVAAMMMLALGATGCANVKNLVSPQQDIAVQQAKRTAEALQVFESRRDFAQFQAARARWREGNLAACREALEGLLERSPQHFEARALLAELLLSEEEYESARKHLELAIALRPDDARLQHMMGLLLEATEQEADALTFYQRAAELEPQNEQYSQSCRASTGSVPGPVGATEAAPKATNPSPVALASDWQSDAPNGQGSGQRLLADAERAFTAGDVPTARSLLTQAIAFEPDDAELLVRAAVLSLRHEQPDTAVFLLQPTAGRFSDSAAVQRTLGTAYYRQGDYGAAQRALQQALSLDKSNALAYLLMGCTLEKLGQSAAAKSHFEQARRLDPRL
ncbi:MAG: tetratricopeptide repeat protein [Planctomycetia bacterium]|nr:tetratricopeptide repeat protein [Planctomycetia bacterium]